MGGKCLSECHTTQMTSKSDFGGHESSFKRAVAILLGNTTHIEFHWNFVQLDNDVTRHLGCSRM